MTKEEQIEARAREYARAHKNSIAKRLTNSDYYPPEECPVSVFMAGSPGAGKTEASIELLEGIDGEPIIRIDPDELRYEFPDYSGGNAWLFQGPVSTLVNRILDKVHKQKQSFLLDGTLSSLEVAQKNIKRSLDKGRMIQILYVYQRPELAWSFVADREAEEGRRIYMDSFIEQYFAARRVVNRLKEEFGKDIRVDVLMKNDDNTSRWYKAGVDRIDNHIDEPYSLSALKNLLNRR